MVFIFQQINREFIPLSLNKKIEIIGSAHNIKEIEMKKYFQGCEYIFFSRLFKLL